MCPHCVKKFWFAKEIDKRYVEMDYRGGTVLQWCRVSGGSVVRLYSPVHNGDKVEFNTVLKTRSTLLEVNCCQNRQQSLTFNFVADTFKFVAGVGNKSTVCRGRFCCRYGRLCCWYGRRLHNNNHKCQKIYLQTEKIYVWWDITGHKCENVIYSESK